MFMFTLSKEEVKALWETIDEKEKSIPQEESLDSGFDSLRQKIRQGPLYAVNTDKPIRQDDS